MGTLKQILTNPVTVAGPSPEGDRRGPGHRGRGGQAAPRGGRRKGRNRRRDHHHASLDAPAFIPVRLRIYERGRRPPHSPSSAERLGDRESQTTARPDSCLTRQPQQIVLRLILLNYNRMRQSSMYTITV